MSRGSGSIPGKILKFKNILFRLKMNPYNNIQSESDLNNLQYNISEYILKAKNRSEVHFYLQISDVTARYFKRNGVSVKEYEDGAEWLDLFRTINKINTDCDYKKIKENSFYVKLLKPQSKQLLSLNDSITESKGPWRLGVKFIKEDVINLTENNKNILNKY